MKRYKKFSFLIFILILLATFMNKIVNFIVDIKWFNEVKYLSIYFTKIKAIIGLGIPIFIIIFTSVWFYYKSILQNIKTRFIDIDLSKKNLSKKVFFLCNFLVSALISYVFSSHYWYVILQFLNSKMFNISDPLYNKDVSFYVFRLPLLKSLNNMLISILGFLVITTLVIYAILNLGGKAYKISNGKLKGFVNTTNTIKEFAGKQLAIVSCFMFFILSFQYMIKAWELVYSPHGVSFGASYTDVHVSLLFYRIISLVSIVSSILTFFSIIKNKFKPIIISIIVIGGLIAGQGICFNLMQNFLVKSNEKTLEQPYIKNTIDLTRKAFNLDNSKTKNFETKNDLTVENLQENKSSLENIRINSFLPTLEFYNQVQIIRYYYTFNDVDIDRYNVNGKYTQVFLAPREIDEKSLNPNTWQNRHLIYTHGYGVVMNKVNSVTGEGQPDFIIKDIPPYNKTDINLKNPRIYFGEKTNDYAIVDTNIDEFDYPKGDDNQTNKYDGNAGIHMSFLNKILFSINKKDLNFLLSKDINKNSKIIINRNIVNRAKKIAPFLKYDSDPYIVIHDGRVYWILDAYTTTNKYPYSEPYEKINYIRNSVKVTVDALNGDINFYITDKNDPIVQSYNKIFKGLFKEKDKAPENLRKHFRYPKDLFSIQSKVLGKYHVKDPGVYYNGEDLWEVSKDQKQVDGEKNVNDAPYVILKLPGENKEEMILLSYFNVMKKDNMSALFAIRMDDDHFGEKIIYKLPSDKTIYSPYLFKQKINQDTNISKELSLWNKEGSQVQFGDTIILPIKNSLIYIEPLYLRASGKNSIPEMKRIIVSYGENLVLANTIEEALNEIFNGSLATSKKQDNNIKAPSQIEGEIKKAKDLFNKAIESQKKGDWTSYGININKLGETLNHIN